MWVWWMLSLIVLIACVIFAYRMIVSSYEFLPFDKRYFLKFSKDSNSNQPEPIYNEGTRALKNRIKSFEEDNTFNQIQFTKFHERLKAVEEAITVKSFFPSESKNADKEDWKELFYEENATKERLENELDELRQRLEEFQAIQEEKEIENWKELYYSENEIKLKLENELEILKDKLSNVQDDLLKKYELSKSFSELKGEHDVQLNHILSLEAGINLLQKQFAASVKRENELEDLLISEIIVREKYAMLQSKYTQLQIESSSLQKRIIEQSQKEMNLEIRLMHLGELESKLALCEEEKLKLKSRFENNLLG